MHSSSKGRHHSSSKGHHSSSKGKHSGGSRGYSSGGSKGGHKYSSKGSGGHRSGGSRGYHSGGSRGRHDSHGSRGHHSSGSRGYDPRAAEGHQRYSSDAFHNDKRKTDAFLKELAANGGNMPGEELALTNEEFQRLMKRSEELHKPFCTPGKAGYLTVALISFLCIFFVNGTGRVMSMVVFGLCLIYGIFYVYNQQQEDMQAKAPKDKKKRKKKQNTW